LFRRQSAQIVATLTRSIGARHLSLAEEAVQDAMVTALQQWPFRGLPNDPSAWLFRVARNRALDRLRHQRIVDARASAVLAEARTTGDSAATAQLAGEPAVLADDQLGMMFMTCHPVLPPEARVALTLKIVGGFGVSEIARAFLADERTIAQRLVRAKRLLRQRDVPFGPPAAEEVAARLDSVLEAIYLLFNEGYAATEGEHWMREEMSGEAIRLAGLLTAHAATAQPRAWALLSLLLLHAARFPARASSDGELFLLRDQDRSKWDARLVAEGLRALSRSASGDEVSTYHLQAEIAACHAVATEWDQTDWPRIATCYRALERLTASPIVTLNRVIAEMQMESHADQVREIEALAAHPQLSGYHLLPAVLAELWREAGDARRAIEQYRRAQALARSAPEQRFLAARLASLGQFYNSP
jgi:RNA polymerase sigma-70 factor (ECF subfamily)